METMTSTTTSTIPVPVPLSLKQRLLKGRLGRILNGSFILLLSSFVVAGGNAVYNMTIAHMLGANGFGHANAAFTILMLIASITLSFELVCAKLIAREQDPIHRAFFYHRLLRKSWIAGLSLAAALSVFSGSIARYLQFPHSEHILILSAGIAFFIPLGVKRGAMQGRCAFHRLAWSFIIEVVVKVGFAVLLVSRGLGVDGVIAAVSLSVIAAYFLPPVPPELRQSSSVKLAVSYREGLQAIFFFVGQVVITNVDVLVIKHFFSPEQAGLYAGVALVGRVGHLLSWSVIRAMFPVSASTSEREQRPLMLLMPVALVSAICGVCVLALGIMPVTVLHVAFGKDFGQAIHGLRPLVMLYATMTGIYSVAVVLMVYEMSRRVTNAGLIQLAFAGMIVAGIYGFHRSLGEVVLVQLSCIVLLLLTVALPVLRHRFYAGLESSTDSPRPLKITLAKSGQ